MKKNLLIGLFSLFVVLSASAQTQGERVLEQISSNLKEMVDYESDITVDVKGSTIEGSYRVSGESYHINMQSVELWGQGDRRYEVSHKTQEVVIERVVGGDNMLLSNPARAFDLVGEGFDVKLEPSGEVIVLKPKADGKKRTMDVDKITIYIDPKSSLPTKILYDADNDRASIEFKGIKKSKSPLGNIDLSKYKKYDVVDLY
ncbi:MAG: hypothetical protein SNG02_06945 [Rikenellaceae bacterium]